MTLMDQSAPADDLHRDRQDDHLEGTDVAQAELVDADQVLDPAAGSGHFLAAAGTALQGRPERAPEVVTNHLALLAQLAREWRARAIHGDLDRLSVSDAQLLDSLARDLLPAPGVAESMAKLAARDALEQAGRAAARAQDDLRRGVALFRKRGGTWTEVGAMFGITRQAAAKRFAPVDPGRRFEAPAEVAGPPADDHED